MGESLKTDITKDLALKDASALDRFLKDPRVVAEIGEAEARRLYEEVDRSADPADITRKAIETYSKVLKRIPNTEGHFPDTLARYWQQTLTKTD